ncbi:MAG: CHAT domain-containing protein [Acidobacteria bacterium]|nr:CHAT domain-containing protein [Acidobacteriota bacterium]MBV9476830.1 CHAT domain-containing protein [Acidobacteriota bacterium]
MPNLKALSLVALVTCLALEARADWLPQPDSAPMQKMGGLVSIPGAPLPPVSPDVVRMTIRWFEPVLAGLRLFGDTPAVGRGCGYLATLYAAVGDDAKAEQLFDEAEAILNKSGAAPLYRAWVENNRGMWHNQSGRHDKAIKCFRNAVELLHPEKEETREPRLIMLQNLGTAYWLLGDVDHAELTFGEAIDSLRPAGMEHSRTAQILRADVEMLDASIGDFVSARSVGEKLLEEPNLDRTVRFQVLMSLGYTLASLRNFDQAVSRLTEARSLTADRSAERLMVLMNLATVYATAEDYDHTDPLAQETLVLAQKLNGENSRMAAAAMTLCALTALSRNELVAADRLLTRAIAILQPQPGDDELRIRAIRELALVAQFRGQTERATTLGRQAHEQTKQQLQRILAFGSEMQRLAYRAQAAPFDQLANLGDPSLLADAALTMKGVVLDSLLADRALARRSNSPEDRDQLDRISELKVRLMEETSRSSAAPESLQRELVREETALARRLSREAPQHQVPISLPAVQRTLGPQAVLVEIIRYQRYTSRAKAVWAYGGVVIPQSGSASWVPLSDAEPIDAAISKLTRRVQGQSRSATSQEVNDALAASDEEMRSTLRSLYQSLWAPLVRALPEGTQQVFLSPDGATSFLPWAVLLDEKDRFVLETWQLTQVGSGRDLLRPAPPSFAHTVVAFADGRGDLIYSRREVEAIAKISESHGWAATILAGEVATEHELVRQRNPGVLHFATHGGQLDDDASQAIANRLNRNPMYRGFILLAEGGETLKRWSRGETVPAADDGILTAEEASGLDLSHTWLTVLAACDTGAGDVSVGEGILGLRRGFALAGTQYLLFSLWPIDDAATAAFMRAFYARLFATGDAAAAFHETQRDELLRWKASGQLTRTVEMAGAFVLTK